MELVIFQAIGGTPGVAAGAAALRLTVIAISAAEVLAWLGATWMSFTATAREYFAECRAARLAARPDPGPTPKVIRYACLAWCVAGVLYGVGVFLSVADQGFREMDLTDSWTWIMGLGVPLCSLLAARFFAVGSIVARRWLVTLGVLVSVMTVLATSLDEKVTAHTAFVIILAAIGVVVAAVLSFLEPSREFIRLAQPR